MKMSCIVMNPEPIAALANAIESLLNSGYNFWGFDAPDSLFLELSDCKTTCLYHSTAIYRRLYMLNVRAYNGRYKNHEAPMDEEIPNIDVNQYTVHHAPAFREHGFAARPWHYHLAKLADYWIYQTSEDAVRGDPLRQAVREFRDCLYAFIIRNSPSYTAVRWGELPSCTEKAKRETVYYINTIPGKAAAQKGHADFPEDFSHLRLGESFTAWRVGQDWEVETTLSGEPLFARLKAIKEQESSERTQELRFILSFAEENCFDTELARSQLRSLWTAYCLRHSLDADTSGYDCDLMEIWAKIEALECDTACWSDYDSFSGFMCAELV